MASHPSTPRARRTSWPQRALKEFLPSRLLRTLVLLLILLYFGLPLLWMLLAPSKTREQLASQAPFSFGSFGNYATAYHNLMSYDPSLIMGWFQNSLVYTGLMVVLSVLTSVPAGYALACTRVPFKKTILIITLVVMVTPAAARTIPLFMEMSALGLTNTMWAVVLPAALQPFNVYLAYIYYSTSIPKSLLEAARIDGAGEWSLFRMAVSLSVPVIVIITFFTFTGAWNDYFGPFVMLADDTTYTLPVGLGVLMSNAPGVMPSRAVSNLPIFQPEVALAGLIVVLPILLVFLFSQRFLATGILDGAVKD